MKKRTKTGPLSKLLAIGNLDQRDLVLGAQSNDELLVGLLLAVLVQDTHVGLTTVQSLGSLTETASKTVVDESELQDTLQSVQNGHLTLGGIAGNLDLIGDLGGVVFYVRLIPANVSIVSADPPSSLVLVLFAPPPKINSHYLAFDNRSGGGRDNRRGHYRAQTRSRATRLTILYYFSCRAILEDSNKL